MNALDRRRFLAHSAATMFGAAVATGSCHAADAADRRPAANTIIDTHTHFYDPTRPQGVPWPGKGDPRLYRPMLPKNYQEVAGPHGVTGTVVVEASPWLEDNQWLLELAEKEPLIVGVVGNLNPGTEQFAAHVKRFAANRFYRGIRISHGALKEGMGQTQFLRDLNLLAEHDLELDVNGGPDMPADVALLAAKTPELRIVINHLGNVAIDGETPPAAWRSGMEAAGNRLNVFCKVSAVVEGAARNGREAPADPGYYVPVLDVAWKTFGVDRLIYGSNWPVSERAASYATVQQIVESYFAGHGREAREKFFWRNALAAYKWILR